MSSKLLLKNIVPASLFARTFGAVIDLLITVLIGAGIFLGLSNIAYQIPSIKQYRDHYYRAIVDSGLMELENDALVPLEFDSYEQYQTLFYDFYHEYYAFRKNTNYDIYWFNVFVYGQDDTLGQYSATELSARPALIRTIGKQLFSYRLDGLGEKQHHEFALPTVSNNGSLPLSVVEVERLVSYFYVADEDIANNPLAKEYRYIYFYALADLTSLSSLQSDYDHFIFLGTTLPLVMALFVTFMIFYLAIPLFLKNGRTIGKIIMKTCLVNKLGYQYHRLQLIPRVLFPTFLTLTLFLVMGLSLYPFMIISLFVLASFGFMLFSKSHQAFHDYFAGTLVVDAQASTWFKDIESETRAQQEIDDFVDNVKHNSDPQ